MVHVGCITHRFYRKSYSLLSKPTWQNFVGDTGVSSLMIPLTILIKFTLISMMYKCVVGMQVINSSPTNAHICVMSSHKPI